MQRLWNQWYRDGKYSELWFQWDGKPLILGDVNAKTKEGAPIPDEFQNFFTWRQSWFETNPKGWFGDGQGKWPWRDRTPQQPGLSPTGAVEQVAVGVASHPIGANIGRSYANKTARGVGSIRHDYDLRSGHPVSGAVGSRPGNRSAA